MITADLLSLLQFNQRWTLRTLPMPPIGEPEQRHLLSLFSATEVLRYTRAAKGASNRIAKAASNLNRQAATRLHIQGTEQ